MSLPATPTCTYTVTRAARLINHDCGAQVWAGLDQLSGWEPSLADPTPLDDLAEAVAYLDGRGVFTLMPAPGGLELHRREDWHLFDHRWPALAGHACTREER